MSDTGLRQFETFLECFVPADEFLVDEPVLADGDLGEIMLKEFLREGGDQPFEQGVVGFGVFHGITV